MSWDFRYEGLEDTWNEHKESILKDYIKQHPGKRPWAWWRFDAPRWSKDLGARTGRLPEPRQRIGGTGDTAHEAMGYLPMIAFGIPQEYVKQHDVDSRNGRLKREPCSYWPNDSKEGDFDGIAIDWDDPPTFEAEATYLKRHGLLPISEEKRLNYRDFEPESCLRTMTAE